MNTFKHLTGNAIAPKSPRGGFYVEDKEDHITTVLFQNWALYPNSFWLKPLLDACLIDSDSVSAVRWSYAYVGHLDGKETKNKRERAVDIVLMFRDRHGDAVIVFEAKKPGTAPNQKDFQKLRDYANLPEIRTIKRRYRVFLVDEAKLQVTQELAGDQASTVTWQQLAALQIDSTFEIPESDAVIEAVVDLLTKQWSYFKILEAPAEAKPFKASSVPDPKAKSVREYLVGSEIVDAVRRGESPNPPYDWLEGEPSCLQVYEEGYQNVPGYQTSPDRERVLWRL